MALPPKPIHPVCVHVAQARNVRTEAGVEINGITDRILGAAVEVHRRLGPGLLESAYAACLPVEMTKRDLRFEREFVLPVRYDQLTLDCGYRLDFLVERQVVLELKAESSLQPIHTAQLLTYLRLGGYPVGLLINFNTPYLGEGAIRRLVNGYRGPKPIESRGGTRGTLAPDARTVRPGR
jgi:GxxExxY protein